MTRPLAVLRPEPGNAATATRIERQGSAAIRLPLFAVHPCDWTPPDPGDFDSLLLTSANAIRQAGAGLATLTTLPVLAVGAATARAARDAGLAVRLTGKTDARGLLERGRVMGVRHALHLAGRERVEELPGVARVVTVYASDPLEPSPAAIRALAGSVALLHSARAAGRLAELVDVAGIDRDAIRLAAASESVLHAAGTGWDRIASAAVPTDEAIVAAGVRLAG